MVFTAFCLPAMLIGANFALDPSEIYHKSFFYPKCRTFDSIEKDAGHIKHYLNEYDAAILGSSLSLNFDLDLLKKTTGKKFFMTAASGLQAKSIATIARHMLAHDKDGRIQTVYWELYHQKTLKDGVMKDNFAAYLLNDDVSDDLPYLMSFKTFQNGLKVVKKECFSEKYAAWRYDKRHEKTAQKYRSAANVAQLNAQIARNRERLKNWTVEPRSVSAVENDLLPLVRAYADRDYVFFVPPTNLADLTSFSVEELNAYFAMIKALVDESRRNPRIKVYAAVWNKELITDASRYRDDQHYIGSVSDDMVREIIENERTVDAENYPLFVKDMTAWIKTAEMRK